MDTTEFRIDPNAENVGLGTLLITDARVLVRPAAPGQYPASVAHDSAHACNILSLGNDMGRHTTHIVCADSPDAARQALGQVFHTYVDTECLDLWCDARVRYIANGNTVWVDEYGFADGQYTMYFNVYCNVPEDETEKLLATLTNQVSGEHFVVVRPEQSELGYKVRGFAVDKHEEDDPREDEPDDEDPLAGDVDPTGGYYEPPVSAFTAHHLSVMRQHGDYTG